MQDRDHKVLSGRSKLRSTVWQRLEEREAELVALCRQLIQIPSVNGVHPEAAVAGAIADAMRAGGLNPALPIYEAGRPNVVAEIGHGEQAVILLGHMDTVPEGEHSLWSVEPFSAELRSGRIIGRGACDNKAGIAVAVIILSVLAEFEEELQGRVVVACVPDEESGATGRIGITPLLREGYIPRAGQAIYTYPGLQTLCIGHRGLLRVRVHARGKATHTGGEAWEYGEGGANAVTALAEYLLALEAWRPEYEPHPAFPGRRPVVTPGTLIHGGEIESMVPASAEAMVDVRLLPGHSGDDVLAAMRLLAEPILQRRPGVGFSWDKRIDLPAVAIPRETPIVQALAHWTATLAGQTPMMVGAGPANEGYLMIQAGIPTVCGFGPPGGNAHAADEYVELSGLLLAAKIYAAAIIDLLLPDTKGSRINPE
jgi:acetylornithine deacetylase/succinyl-diaminopimelate desuccinylase-like protein